MKKLLLIVCLAHSQYLVPMEHALVKETEEIECIEETTQEEQTGTEVIVLTLGGILIVGTLFNASMLYLMGELQFP